MSSFYSGHKAVSALKRWKISILFLTLCIVAFIGLKYYPMLFTHGQGGFSMPAPEIAVLPIAKQSFTSEKQFAGRTVAYKIAEIRPQVGGIITAKLFEEGSDVTEGTQLYQIDENIFKANLETAEANLKKAEATAKSIAAKKARYDRLVKIKAISSQEYNDIEASLADAEANAAIAKAEVTKATVNLNYSKVMAPISGKVGTSSVTEGALVSANQQTPITSIISLDPIYVDVNLSAADFSVLRQGAQDSKFEQEVSLYVDGSKYGSAGKVQSHDFSIDPTTGMVKLRALFENKDSSLLPGLFVKAEIKIQYNDAIVIPEHIAQIVEGGKLVVLTIAKDGTVVPAPIEATRISGGNLLVTNGLKEGDMVATEGFIKMQPGMKVKALIPETPKENSDTHPAEAHPPATKSSSQPEPSPRSVQLNETDDQNAI